MKKNQLGKSDLWVSEIGFGCMSIGTDLDRGVRLIHEALERGVNFFDTADLYDHGRNEEIVGAALKTCRQDIILATKVGNRWNEGSAGWTWDPSKGYIKQAVKDSLKRLQTDYIDLYQLHGGTMDDPISETIEAFEELKQEGFIRYYGISSIRPNVIREYVKQSNIVSVMSQYSLLDRRPEEEILPLLKQHQISLIARGPLAKGNLSARVFVEEGRSGFQDYTSEEIKELVRKLQAFSGKERSIAQVANRYILSHPAVATIIPGASRIEQLVENIETAITPVFSGDEIMKLREWTKANTYQQHR